MSSLERALKALLRPILPDAMQRRLSMVLFLVGPANRRQLLLQLALNAGLGVMEVLSVVSVFPFLAVAARPDVIHKNPYMAAVHDALGFQSDRAFLVFLGLALLLVLVATTGARVLVTWANTRFLTRLGEELTVALTRNYLRQPYGFFLQQHTSNLHSRILQDVRGVNQAVMQPAFSVCAKLISTGLLLGALVVANPVTAAVVLAVLGGGYWLIYRVLRPRLASIGEALRENDRAKMRAVHECFSGIKVAKVMNLEPHLLRSVEETAARSARLRVTDQLQQQLPVQAMEVALFLLIILGTLYIISALPDFSHAIPILGVYAFGAYKLKPGIMAIYQAATQMKKGLPRVDAVYEHLLLRAPARRRPVLAGPPPAPGTGEPPRVELRGVSFTYPGAPRPTLHDIHLAIHRDTTVGLRGPTGSGKTTLLDILLGLLPPDEGLLLVDGKPVRTDDDVRAWQRRVGYVPQDIYLTDASIARNIAYGVPEEEVDHDAVRSAATLAQLADFIEQELPDRYDTKVGERGVRLSGGQRQRVGIARALYRKPDVLVFDEATSALDNETEAAVMQAVAALSHQLTIIMVAHRLSTLHDCDVVHQLRAGALLERATKALA